jgi:hypothetical protein
MDPDAAAIPMAPMARDPDITAATVRVIRPVDIVGLIPHGHDDARCGRRRRRRVVVRSIIVRRTSPVEKRCCPEQNDR